MKKSKGRSRKRSVGSAFVNDNDEQNKSDGNATATATETGSDGHVQSSDTPNPGSSKSIKLEVLTAEPTASASTVAPATPPRNPAGICFRNKLILSKIASGLPARTLLAHRQLSPAWNEVVIPEIQKKHTPIYFSSSALFQKDKTTKMKAYTHNINNMRRSQHIPFSKYHIELETCPKTLGLFSAFGNSISSLSIRENYWHGLDIHMLRKIIFDKAPQLKTVELSIHTNRPVLESRQRTPPPRELPVLKSLRINWVGDNLSIDSLVKDLIRFGSGLESFACLTSVRSDRSVRTDQEDYGRRSTISSLRDFAPHLEQLTTLVLHDIEPIGIQVLTELTQRKNNGLHLKTLSVTLTSRYPRTSLRQEFANPFHNFLQAQSSTLRQLEIGQKYTGYNYTSEIPPLIRVPEMDRLHSFSYTTVGLCEFVLQFDANTLANNFPHLRSFSRDSSERPGDAPALNFLSDPNLYRHDGITDLKFKNTFTTPVRFSQLGQFYPTVVHAHLILEQGLTAFNYIWTMWPSLQTLKLSCVSNVAYAVSELDELLSGVPSAHFGSLKQSLSHDANVELTVDHVRDIWKQYKTMPGLGDLRHLRKLIIQLNDYYAFQHYCKVTDIGGYFGLAMTNSLQFLAVNKVSLSVPQWSATPEAYRGKSITAYSAKCGAMIRDVLGPYAVIEME